MSNGVKNPVSNLISTKSNPNHKNPNKPEYTKINIKEVPLDIDMAYQHGEAQKLYNFSNELQIEQFEEVDKINSDKNTSTFKLERCKCCKAILTKDSNGNYIYPDLIKNYNFNCDIKDFSANAGVGIYLYFFFMKFSIFILLIGIILSSIPLILLSYEIKEEIKDFCKTKQNDFNIFSLCLEQNYFVFNNTKYDEDHQNANLTNIVVFLRQISYKTFSDYKEIEFILINKNTNVGFDFSIIGIITEGIILIVYLIVYIVSYNTIKEIDFLCVTASDFTLMISDLDKNFKSKKDLLEYLKAVFIFFYNVIVTINTL